MVKLFSIYLFTFFSLQPAFVYGEPVTAKEIQTVIHDSGCFSKDLAKRKDCLDGILGALTDEEKIHYAEPITNFFQKALDVQIIPYEKNGQQEVRLHITFEGEESKSVQTDLVFTKNGLKEINQTALDHSKIQSVNGLLVQMIQKNAAFRKTYLEKGGLLPVALSTEMLNALSFKQQQEFLAKIRVLIEAASEVDRVFSDQFAENTALLNNETFWGSQHLSSIFGFLNTSSFAKTGDSCIIAGNISQESSSGSCESKKFQSNCSGGQVECNPLLYGYSNAGSSYCVTGGSGYIHATKECHNQVSTQKFPDSKNPTDVLNSYSAEEKQKIIDSFLAKNGKDKTKKLVDGKFDPSDKQKIDSFLQSAMKKNGPILQMAKKCETFQQKATKGNTKNFESRKSACIGLQASLFEVEYLVHQSNCPTTEGAAVATASTPATTAAVKTNAATASADSATQKDTSSGAGGSSKLAVCTAEKPVFEKLTEADNAVKKADSGSGIPTWKKPTAKSSLPSSQKSFWERNKSWLFPLGIFTAGLGIGFLLGKYLGKKVKTKIKTIYQTNTVYVPTPTPAAASEGGAGASGVSAGGVGVQ